MKKTIQVAANLTKVEKKDMEVDLPEVAKYYYRNDDGRFFPRGEIIFAIIPRGRFNSYSLVEIERNKQDFNDFLPEGDCKNEYWISGENKLRKQAFRIMTEKYHIWKEITKEEFDMLRSKLLDQYKEYEL